MNTLVRLWLAVVDRPPQLPPVEPGIGQRIQAREQEAAKARLLAQAHRRAGGHLYDGPAR